MISDRNTHLTGLNNTNGSVSDPICSGEGGDCSNEPLQRLLEPGELGGTDRIRTGNQCRLAVNTRVRSSSASRPNLSLCRLNAFALTFEFGDLSWSAASDYH